ncbi:D-2-hydroxyacid dehydrogenase [Leptospira interrogans]
MVSKEELTICFAHVAYQLGAQFAKRNTGINHFQVWNREDLDRRIGEADVLVISGLWHNDLIGSGKNLRFIQSVGAGTDQFPRDQLSTQGIRLASASGVNVNAVSEHAMALILALARRLPEARDNQAQRVWRGMIGDLTKREDELGGKTLLIVGLGKIGNRLARLARAFDMRVLGVRRNPAAGKGEADSVHDMSELKSLLPQADIIALTCSLTSETENLIDADSLGRMKPSAFLVNAARGKVVNEAALVAAMHSGVIAGAGIDVTTEEPLPASSPLWEAPNTFITPHTAGETRKYEDNVIDILQENLDRLWRGEKVLHNQVL